MGRPQFFTIDQSHQLARGLMFAGLGNAPGSKRYNDSSGKSNHAALNYITPSSATKFDRQLQRPWIATDSGNILTGAIAHNIGTGPFSVSVWAYHNDSGENDCVAGFNALAFSFWVVSGSRTIYLNDGSVKSFSGTLPFVTWTHFTWVRIGSTITMYVNGIADATTVSSSASIANGAFSASDDNQPLSGGVADPLLHNRALSLPEIRILANRSDPMLSGLIRPIGSESNIYDREGIR